MRIWWALASLLLVVPAVPGDEAEIEAENLLKAEFIDRFAIFIQWPGQVESDLQPFVVGIYGRTPLADTLREVFRERRILERPVRVVELPDLDGVSDCQVLFIAGSEADDLGRILERTAAKPILTIADSDGFARRGVLINLVRQGGNIRFEINPQAVERTGLRFSSQLLRLAKLVESDAATDGSGSRR